jgi:hypothetical protein
MLVTETKRNEERAPRRALSCTTRKVADYPSSALSQKKKRSILLHTDAVTECVAKHSPGSLPESTMRKPPDPLSFGLATGRLSCSTNHWNTGLYASPSWLSHGETSLVKLRASVVNLNIRATVTQVDAHASPPSTGSTVAMHVVYCCIPGPPMNGLCRLGDVLLE